MSAIQNQYETLFRLICSFCGSFYDTGSPPQASTHQNGSHLGSSSNNLPFVGSNGFRHYHHLRGATGHYQPPMTGNPQQSALGINLVLVSHNISITIQSVINTKISQQTFWHCLEHELIKTIPMIPYENNIEFQANCAVLTWIKAYPR